MDAEPVKGGGWESDSDWDKERESVSYRWIETRCTRYFSTLSGLLEQGEKTEKMEKSGAL